MNHNKQQISKKKYITQIIIIKQQNEPLVASSKLLVVIYISIVIGIIIVHVVCTSEGRYPARTLILVCDHTESLAHPLHSVHFALAVCSSLVCISYLGSFLCHRIRCSCGCYRFSCRFCEAFQTSVARLPSPCRHSKVLCWTFCTARRMYFCRCMQSDISSLPPLLQLELVDTLRHR